jgi:hypothetical protein
MLLDEAVFLQRAQQPVHGRLRQPDAVGEVAEAEAARMLPECLEDADGAVDGLNGLRCYCRTSFDIVE